MSDNKYRNIDGIVVAESHGDTLYKTVNKNKHIFRNMQGWGFDTHIIEQAKQAGIKNIQVTDADEDKVYQSSLDNYIEHAVPVNYGYGDQLILPGRYWTIDNQLQLSLF